MWYQNIHSYMNINFTFYEYQSMYPETVYLKKDISFRISSLQL